VITVILQDLYFRVIIQPKLLNLYNQDVLF